MRELGQLALKRRLRAHLINVHKHLKGELKKDGQRLSSGGHYEGKREELQRETQEIISENQETLFSQGYPGRL